ncbi:MULTISPECIES: hypothetical protein [unclassified Nocardiopsis]|uniref:hypothetical protein n=1 Tax=Nocardiopsis TaxID=2013 RepID=UPI00387AB042
MTHSPGDHDVPADLARWGLHAFALGARSTPHAVVAMDDNGVLLHHARGGTTLAELRARGVTPSQSRLELLRLYGLITTDGDRVTTAFPVVGPEALAPLRPRIRRLAADSLPGIGGEVAAIAAELRRRGHTGHDYTVVFGHAVDGLLWDRLRARGLAPSTELSIERPYWNGAFWAIHPPNEGGAGVNELPGAAATLVMVWTRDTAPALRKLSGSAAVRRLLEDPAAQTGIPVLAAGDALHHHALDIAETIARTIERAGELRAAIPDTDRHQGALILAHEFIWALMEELVAAGHLEPPAALRGREPTPRALNEQVFLRLH